jgi:hypothetical protein
MSMNSIDTGYWHDYYEEKLSRGEHDVVDVAFEAMRHALDRRGIRGLTDDRAERLIAAITEYVVSSIKENPEAAR